MKMYKLSQILETTKHFAKEPDAQQKMEKALRKKEALLQGISEEKVEIVSDDSLLGAISELTCCVFQLYIAVLSKFNELGYRSVEEN